MHGAQTGPTQRGVFVTTALFSKSAVDCASDVPVRVVLIDGPQLAQLMLRYRIGVEVSEHFELVTLDEPYSQD